jgi:hypothetical protein
VVFTRKRAETAVDQYPIPLCGRDEGQVTGRGDSSKGDLKEEVRGSHALSEHAHRAGRVGSSRINHGFRHDELTGANETIEI